MSANTTGVVWIHSTPSALCPHLEWALGGLFGAPVTLDWTPQPVEPGSYRAELTFRQPVGTAARIASTLAKWGRVRFEVTEDATTNSAGLPTQGQRFSYTPTLGAHQATMGPHGDVMVHEEQLRAALAAGEQGLAQRVERLLGAAWDAELEVFRHGGQGAIDNGAELRWLHRVG